MPAILPLPGVVAADREPFRCHGPDAFDEQPLCGVRMPYEDSVSRAGRRCLMRADNEPVAGLERGRHASARDPHQTRPAHRSPRFIADEATDVPENGGSGLKDPHFGHPPASTHSTSRPLVFQKMSWMFLIASMSSSACCGLTSTLQAEQSLAAFQNVVCRSGYASRCGGLK